MYGPIQAEIRLTLSFVMSGFSSPFVARNRSLVSDLLDGSLEEGAPLFCRHRIFLGVWQSIRGTSRGIAVHPAGRPGVSQFILREVPILDISRHSNNSRGTDLSPSSHRRHTAVEDQP
ncbi:hypothetical protein PoB_007133400 [Plakobranchus ocellatus]|uniref:Uncharacterized protein n=1 Tax=Plakobranchus ocellatus TaxID=259542 RepID=A0AAV4DKX2_9GAST|nr:hypothetical protein PoB_007133400 [Plakobranchus ocellatus]